MSYTVSYGWGPGSTPRLLTYLIASLAAIAICSALVDGFFVYFLEMRGPQALLSLSWSGLHHWYIWQPITYLFVLSSGNAGLSLSFFIELLFDLYLLWIMGTALIERLGSGAFFRLYYIAGILTGLLTIFCMPIFQQYTELAGPSAALIAIFTAWTMLNPESELLLFFVIPIKAKWLFAGFFGITLLVTLSHLNFITAAFYFFSVLIAYLYATTVWGLYSPFPFTQFVDNFFIKIGAKLRSWVNDKNSKRPITDKNVKIFDFHTGKPLLDDDAFMDQALDKILKHGEKSLTWSERSRMKKISQNKSSHNKGHGPKSG